LSWACRIAGKVAAASSRRALRRRRAEERLAERGEESLSGEEDRSGVDSKSAAGMKYLILYDADQALLLANEGEGFERQGLGWVEVR
jgi:hypothetical protein